MVRLPSTGLKLCEALAHTEKTSVRLMIPPSEVVGLLCFCAGGLKSSRKRSFAYCACGTPSVRGRVVAGSGVALVTRPAVLLVW